MHIIVVGCGRVGSTVAADLIEQGHTVCVVDRRKDAFLRLPPDFGGRTLEGVGFDRDVLREAGIEQPAVALAAVTSGDNSNIMIARVARETFGVENVIARIYDPRRAQVYERLGITTVASVAWTAARVMRKLLPSGLQPVWVDPSATYIMVEEVVPAAAAGRSVADIQESVGGKIVLIRRDGVQRLGERSTLLQEGDRVHVMIASGDETKLDHMFEAAQGAH